MLYVRRGEKVLAISDASNYTVAGRLLHLPLLNLESGLVRELAQRTLTPSKAFMGVVLSLPPYTTPPCSLVHGVFELFEKGSPTFRDVVFVDGIFELPSPQMVEEALGLLQELRHERG